MGSIKDKVDAVITAEAIDSALATLKNRISGAYFIGDYFSELQQLVVIARRDLKDLTDWIDSNRK